jgi:hypothetical protein
MVRIKSTPLKYGFSKIAKNKNNKNNKKKMTDLCRESIRVALLDGSYNVVFSREFISILMDRRRGIKTL